MNFNKIQKSLFDFKRSSTCTLSIDGTAVEISQRPEFVRLHIIRDLNWTVKVLHQTKISTAEHISVSDSHTVEIIHIRKNLQKVVRTTASQLTSIETIERHHCLAEAHSPPNPAAVCPSRLPAEGAGPQGAELPGSYPLPSYAPTPSDHWSNWAGLDICLSTHLVEVNFYNWISCPFLLPLSFAPSIAHHDKILFCCVTVSNFCLKDNKVISPDLHWLCLPYYKKSRPNDRHSVT